MIAAPPSPARIEPLGGALRAAAFAKLHADAFARPWGEAAFATLLAEPTTRAHGLFIGSDLAGFAVSQLVGDEAEVLTVTVAPRWRGQGHAGPLLARHLDDLAAEGGRLVHLEVEAGNAPALALYARAGFCEVGRRPGYYAKGGGDAAEAIRMTRAPEGASLALAEPSHCRDGAREPTA